MVIEQKLINRVVLVMVLTVSSVAFFGIIKPFLVSIFLAALFAALFHPLYERILKVTGNRSSLASFITILLVCCFVFIPFGLVVTTAVGQALDCRQCAPLGTATIGRARHDLGVVA